MTLEEMFIKEYQDQKKELVELEKNKKLVEIELKEKESLLKEITKFIKLGEPSITENEYLYMSYFLGGEEKTKAIELIKKLGVEIKEVQQ